MAALTQNQLYSVSHNQESKQVTAVTILELFPKWILKA